MATNRYPKVTVKTEIFLTSGTWTRPSGVDSIDYFLVAGGGGGGVLACQSKVLKIFSKILKDLLDGLLNTSTVIE